MESEQSLENNLIKNLEFLGYKKVEIKNEVELLENLKKQLEIHNNVELSEREFEKVLNHLNKGNVFDRAKILRDKMMLQRDDGKVIYLDFLNKEKWCQNEYQVTRQITMSGKYKNRYDVTLLVNGLPLVQIELKRRGLELKEAFNQVNRYQRHSFASSYGLFQYIQIFVISNGVNTKYYANNRRQSFQQTFFWTNKENEKYSQLEKFTENFLEPCHLSKMIAKYIVLAETDQVLMVLRPYQYYAVEALVEKVKNNGKKNGYIWHTTGSGKTLTSFKASQVLVELPEVEKVVFVVDRRDLDYQTTKEFNSFSAGSVDGTDNTHALVKQFSDDTKLIVTTIQKLNNAISSKRHFETMQHLKNKKMVFIFDECHRNQFGETHARIKKFFKNIQMFGFTGTPIFADNAIGKRTTKDLFEECLHKYVITDAIRDRNVLRFAIEYVGRYREKKESKNEIDIEVEAIDTRELMESEERAEKIVDYIIANHDKKTHRKEFTGIFCVSSVDMLIKYYDIFLKKKLKGEHNLNLATVFTYAINEDDREANGHIPDEFESLQENTSSKNIDYHSREKLDEYMLEYNKNYGTNFTIGDSNAFYQYSRDISKRVKKREIDLLVVVNMFLTGFDSKYLNTLYADKNLRYHGLIQSFSRTNRILNEQKSHGNIVSFRNLKESTDEAIALYSNKEAKEVIFMEPYEHYVEIFNKAVKDLRKIAPDVNSVDDLEHEEEELKFVKAFRKLMREHNILQVFTDFNYDDLDISEQEFQDYKSKYLDIYQNVRESSEKEKVSILDDIDFELELIHRDEINVAYILKLLEKLKKSNEELQQKIKDEITKLLSSEPQLRTKRELIEKFIEESLPHVENVDEGFEEFWDEEKVKAFNKMCEENGLKKEKIQGIIDDYLFTERNPLGDDIIEALESKPKIMERQSVIKKTTQKIIGFINTFIEGL